jgi:hypothetical protein
VSTVLSSISYDPTIPLGFVHPFPLAGVPYTRFFNDIVLVTDKYQNWISESASQARQRSLGLRPLVRERVHQDMTHHSKFAALAQKMDCRFVIYAPFELPSCIPRERFIMNQTEVANAYENKCYFREQFAGAIHIPEYQVVTIEDLARRSLFGQLKKRFGVFVLQAEESLGSRGTFIVKNQEDYNFAAAMLANEERPRVVVSRFVNGRPAGTQICITSRGIFTSGIHYQVTNCPTLCNTTLQNAMKWGGGEVAVPASQHVMDQVSIMATTVGERLARQGYKGIFGIDLMVTDDEEVYAIEINARLTGFSYIISELQSQRGDIPFLLLHALELGDMPYEIHSEDQLPVQPITHGPTSMLVCCNPLGHGIELEKEMQAGVYRQRGDRLVFQRPAWSPNDLTDDKDVLLLCRYNQGDRVPGGSQIFKVIVRGETLEGNDLNARGKELLGTIKRTFRLPA